MIAVKNLSHEPVVVRHSSNILFREIVKPQDTRRFAGFGQGHYIVEPEIQRTIDQRFNPRGGDPYNRIGSRAIP